MANIKTNLRELSVAVTVGLLKNNIDFNLTDLYNTNFFYTKVLEIVSNVDLTLKQQIPNFKIFPEDIIQIINNGYNLGVTIFNHSHFNFKKNDEIFWLGNYTGKDDPIDIQIGDYGFSLKEESFILENMGLYKLINLFTGSNYKYVHIFKQFSPIEFNNWFNITWQILIKYLNSNQKWVYNDSKKYKTSIELIDDKVQLNYKLCNGSKSVTKLVDINSNYDDFEKNTTNQVREHAFSKFIAKVASKKEIYNNAKRHCALIASKNLSSHLMNNLKYDDTLARFLRIHEKEYYYAKTTISGVEIYRVPPKKEFGTDVVIDSIEASVPKDQANIITTIRNKRINKSLSLRNECRYSHGQFNGTPEAKLYYERSQSLLAIYEEL